MTMTQILLTFARRLALAITLLAPLARALGARPLALRDWLLVTALAAVPADHPPKPAATTTAATASSSLPPGK